MQLITVNKTSGSMNEYCIISVLSVNNKYVMRPKKIRPQTSLGEDTKKFG